MQETLAAVGHSDDVFADARDDEDVVWTRYYDELSTTETRHIPHTTSHAGLVRLEHGVSRRQPSIAIRTPRRTSTVPETRSRRRRTSAREMIFFIRPTNHTYSP